MALAEPVQRMRRSLTRLSRFTTQLMRDQLASGPVTLQQFYTLEALLDGPKAMNALAAEVALHQSTLTRVVEKLEARDLVRRTRRAGDQRTVDVTLTRSGRQTCHRKSDDCTRIIAALLELLPADDRAAVVSGLEALAGLFDREYKTLVELLGSCCADLDLGAKQ